MADLPIKELGDEAPVYDRPHIANTVQPDDRARERRRADAERRGAAELVGSPDLVLEALGLGAVRPPHPRQHRAAARRRRRHRARRATARRGSPSPPT